MPAKSRSIRVDADRLDQLIDLVGELVIASAGTQLTATRGKQVEVMESAATLTRLVEDIRGRALALRMVPIGETFQKFQRVVRDVGRELGKEIELVIKGGETELDKSVVEKIGDPLMHLVRNALDHGIKTPEYRLARGKPARGTLTLSAYHDSGSIVIDVSDDGAGLPREKILAKARERGLVPENVTPSDYDIDQLIFEPGFSTADQVSNISGRGVGMDVVKRNVEALRGTVRILTTPGKGTTVRVTLPLTLAIIDGFLITVNGDHYVIPLDMLIECIELTPPRREAASARGYIDLRGKVLPCVWLRDVFGLEGRGAARENVVVVQFGGLRAGLVVDELHGEVQSVIKPLGAMFKSLSGIVGASILGTGNVALIVDVPALVNRCAGQSHELKVAS
jgi:two-component system, chemotaxis family, sensor kinase CheA